MAEHAHLRVDGISRSFAGRRVLTDISFVAATGERIGLIGENGSGKSTLLRIIAGIDTPDVGTVTLAAPGHPRIGLLHQEPPFAPDDSVAAALETAIAPIRAAERALDRSAAALAAAPDDALAAQHYAAALDTATRLEVWDVEARLSAMLAGIGLAAIPRTSLTSELSGGQRARLSLAWLLLNAPDVLLLDEPTNHLDDAAVAYLLGALKEHRGPIVFASHDRAFLDEAATALVDLDPAPLPAALTSVLVQDGAGTGIGVTRFSGGMSEYLLSRSAAMHRWALRYRDEQAELARLRLATETEQQVGHVDWKPRTEQRGSKKFYADRNAKVVSRRVRDARARLAELEAAQLRRPPEPLRFVWDAASQPTAEMVPDHPAAETAEQAEPILTATALAFAGRLSPIDLTVREGEKLLITGPNGAGKSTLLQLLAGTLSPTSGRRMLRAGASIGILTQDTVIPDPLRRGASRTVAEAYRDNVGEACADRVPLATFGLIAQRDEDRSLALLSVGQQRRVALAILLARPPAVLLLDEPGNHLSLALAAQLEEALAKFPGTVVMTSHDRSLRANWAGSTLALPSREA